MATTSHIKISWIKWHWFNIMLKLKYLSGHFGRRAYRDMNALTNDKSIPADYYDKVKNGLPIGYEHEVGSVYAEFLKANFNVYARLNFYVIMMVIAGVILFAQTFSGILPAYNKFVLLGGLILIATLLMLLLIELFINLSGRRRVTPQEYENAQRWLKATFEDSRRSLPFWKMLLILVGLAFEAAAITIIASSYVSDLTRNQALWVGISIGTIGAVMLSFFVHKAGEGLYREHRRDEIKEVISQDDENAEKTSATLKELSPNFGIMLRRKGFFRRHGFLVLAVTIIAGLSTAAFYQRAELNLEIISNQVKTQLSANTDLGLLPKEVTDQQKKSQAAIAKEKAEHARRGMYAALIILGIIFIAINVMGISFGYQHSFYNEKSEHSYQVVKRYGKQDNMKQNALEMNEDALNHVSSKARWFFSKYHNHLESAAKDFYNINLAKALRERQPLIFQEFLLYSQNKTMRQSAPDTPPDNDPKLPVSTDTAANDNPAAEVHNVVPLLRNEKDNKPDNPMS